MKKMINSYKVVLTKDNFVIFLFYFSFFIINGPLENLLTLYIKESGFTEFYIGIFISILSIINIFAPTIISYFSVRYGFFIITILGLGISFLAASISIYLSGFWVFIFASSIIYGRSFINYSLGNKVSFTIKGDRSKFFAVRDLFLFGAISIGGFIASHMLKNMEINRVFFIYSFGFLVPIIILVTISKNGIIKNENVRNERLSFTKSGLSIKGSSAMLKNRSFLGFVLVKIFSVFYSCSMAFLPMLAAEIGFSISNIIALISAITIINCIVSFFLAYYADTKNKKLIYIIDIVVDIIPAILFIISSSKTIFLIAYICVLLKDTFAPISFSYYFDCLDSEMGEMHIGMLDSVGNILGFVMPTLIGLLWVFSYKLVFVIGAIGIIGAAIAAYKLLPEVNENERKIAE